MWRGECVLSSLFRIKEIDLNSVVIISDTYYFCTDTHRLYYDNNNVRSVVPCNIINTELDRVNNTVGTNGLMYYVWENNTLWVFRGGWVQVAGVEYKTNGYYYSENGIIESDISDGSLYIRDTNNIVKGKIRINSTNNKLNVKTNGHTLWFPPLADSLPHSNAYRSSQCTGAVR